LVFYVYRGRNEKIITQSGLSSSALFAAPMATANPQFSALQMAQVQLDNLSFKNIMRQFYSGQMSRGYVDDEELSKMPHITLGQADEDENTTVALMHPVIEYKNNAKESVICHD
jgi:hypothetical protein